MRSVARPVSGAGTWAAQVLSRHRLNRMLLWVVCLLTGVVAPVSANESLIGWLRGFAMPPGTSLQRVGESLSIQGTASAVLELHSSRTVRQIELFYTRHWRDVATADQIRTDVVAEWLVLSMVTNELLTVLQLREDGSRGAYGFLSARRFVTANTASPISPFAGLAYAEQSVLSREQGRESRVFTMRHSEPPDVATLAIRRGLMRRGWQAEARFAQSRANILVMRRDADVLDIVVLSEPGSISGSRIVAHFRTDHE